MPYKAQAQSALAHPSKGIKALGGLAKLAPAAKLPAKAKAKANKAAGIPAHGGRTTIGAMMQNMVG